MSPDILDIEESIMQLNQLIDGFAEIDQTKLTASNAEKTLRDFSQCLAWQSRIFDTTLSFHHRFCLYLR
jgi:hypothetical protein